jgi:hypothetical protein
MQEILVNNGMLDLSKFFAPDVKKLKAVFNKEKEEILIRPPANMISYFSYNSSRL